MPYRTLEGGHVPIRMWTDPAAVEDRALDQLRNVSNLPWVHGVAVMPDVHYGKGATVGSVIAMRDAVSPAAVGVDIGCGMTAVKSVLTVEDLPDDLGRLRAQDREGGAGRARRRTSGRSTRRRAARAEGTRLVRVLEGVRRPARRRCGPARRARDAQMGTLGGGQPLPRAVRRRRRRGLARAALGVAQHRQGAGRAPHRGGAAGCRTTRTCPTGTWPCSSPARAKMDAYRRDLFWAQEYARRNRAVMMALAQNVVAAVLRGQARPLGRVDLLPPQLRGGGAVRRRGAARHPQGRDPRGRRATSASSRARWRPAPTSCGASATRRPSTRPRTARAAG